MTGKQHDERPATDATALQAADPGRAIDAPDGSTTHGTTPAQRTLWLRERLLDALDTSGTASIEIADAHYQYDSDTIEVTTIEDNNANGLYEIRVNRIK